MLDRIFCSKQDGVTGKIWTGVGKVSGEGALCTALVTLLYARNYFNMKTLNVLKYFSGIFSSTLDSLVQTRGGDSR